MSYEGQASDFTLNIARGLVSGMETVHRFGTAPDGIQTTPTDLWNRANAAALQQIWLPPTAARIHSIVSTSASDDGSPVGVGARTLRIWGLTSWSTAEVSEDITLNGVTPVNTVNSYVCINRGVVITSGATSINVGTITATAATDATVQVQMNPGRGQTERIAYAIPSVRQLYIVNLNVAINSSTATDRVDFDLAVNTNPDVQTTNYIVRASMKVTNTGTSSYDWVFDPYFRIDGPAIVKIRGTGSAADIDATAGFNGILVAV